MYLKTKESLDNRHALCRYLGLRRREKDAERSRDRDPPAGSTVLQLSVVVYLDQTEDQERKGYAAFSLLYSRGMYVGICLTGPLLYTYLTYLQREQDLVVERLAKQLKKDVR